MPKTINSLFDTEQEALAYLASQPACPRVPEFLVSRRKWALVFPVKAHVSVSPHIDAD